MEKIAESITPRCKVINPNIIQRCAMHVVSETDWKETYDVGYMAVKQANAGMSGYMIGYERVQDNPYVVKYNTVPLSSVANAEKNSASGMDSGRQRCERGSHNIYQAFDGGRSIAQT